MKPAFAWLALVLALSCFAGAQQGSEAKPAPAKPQVASASGGWQDSYDEQDNVKRQLEQQLRDHSDENGVPRPDLYEKGVAQFQRMKVVPQPGPVENSQAASHP